MEDLESLRNKEKEALEKEQNQRLNNAIALLSTENDESERHDEILDHNEKLEKHNKKAEEHYKAISKIVQKDSKVQEAISKIVQKDSKVHEAIQDNTRKMGEGKDSSGNLANEEKPDDSKSQSKLNEVFKEVTGDLADKIKSVVPGAEYISKIGKILLRKPDKGKDSSGEQKPDDSKSQSKLTEVFKEVTGDLSDVIKKVVPGAEYVSKISKMLLRKPEKKKEKGVEQLRQAEAREEQTTLLEKIVNGLTGLKQVFLGMFKKAFGVLGGILKKGLFGLLSGLIKTILGIGAGVGGFFLKKFGLDLVRAKLMDFYRKLMDSGNNLGRSIFNLIRRLARGVGNALTNSAKSIGRAGVALGKGLGKMVGGTLRGIGKGIAALGNPRVLLGIVALTGLGAAMFVAGKAFQQFSDINWKGVGAGALALGVLGITAALIAPIAPLLLTGALAIGALGLALVPFAIAVKIAAPAMAELMGSFELLNNVDAKNLFLLGPGLVSLAAGMLAFTAGGLISSVLSGVTSLFGAESPFDKLTKIGEAAPALNKMTINMNSFGKTVETFNAAMARLNGDAIKKSFETMAQGIDTLNASMDEISLVSLMKMGAMKLVGPRNNRAAQLIQAEANRKIAEEEKLQAKQQSNIVANSGNTNINNNSSSVTNMVSQGMPNVSQPNNYNMDEALAMA